MIHSDSLGGEFCNWYINPYRKHLNILRYMKIKPKCVLKSLQIVNRFPFRFKILRSESTARLLDVTVSIGMIFVVLRNEYLTASTLKNTKEELGTALKKIKGCLYTNSGCKMW